MRIESAVNERRCADVSRVMRDDMMTRRALSHTRGSRSEFLTVNLQIIVDSAPLSCPPKITP